MAPPPHRRPGFSRKAQYGLFVTYVVAIAGTIVAALLLTISVVDPAGFSALRTFGSEITAPVARVVRDYYSYIASGHGTAAPDPFIDEAIAANLDKIGEAWADSLVEDIIKQLDQFQ